MKSNQKHEQRLIEIRAIPNDENKMTIEGYAIIYDSPASHLVGELEFTETIRSGALDETDMKDVPMRYNHNDNFLLMARTRNSSLRLIKDLKGLKIQADLIDTQSNRDLYKSIKEGLIDKMSFAFTVAKNGDKWTYEDDYKKSTREITKIEKLYDVSVVDTPFYDSTSIYARSLELLDNEKRRLDSLHEREVLKQKIKLKGIM